MSEHMPLADLLALPAGRELDLAIAKLRRMYVVPSTRIMSPEEQHQFLPHVSTDWGASGPLLAEMLAAGMWLEMGLIATSEFELYLIDTNWETFVPTLADAPLAVCRAWATWKYGKEGRG